MDMTRKKYITPLAVTSVVETSSMLLGTSSGGGVTPGGGGEGHAPVIEGGELKRIDVWGTYDEEDLEIY